MNPKIGGSMFFRFFVPVCVASFSYFFGPHSFASNSSNNAVLPTTPVCPAAPNCGCLGGGGCLTMQGFCTSQYSDMPGVNNIAITKIPFGAEFTNVYTDPDSVMCEGVSCNGATTICQVRRLPTTTDSILSQWSPNLHKLPATVTCRYFDPGCSSCCISYAACGPGPCPVVVTPGP
jgi:hypothetical protein